MNRRDRGVWGWAIYDWANSAFATTVMAGFFPVFFKEFWSVEADVNTSTALLGLANSAAGLVLALIAPVLGAIADRSAARKRFLIFFAYLGAIMSAGLFFVHQGDWLLAATIYVLGVIGFSGANIFYDSLLPLIAPEDRLDFVSGLGFSLGYLGGGLLFLINVIMTIKPTWFGLAGPTEAVRWSFLSVGLWWGGFTLITIAWTPKESPVGEGIGPAIQAGLRQLRGTLSRVGRLKPLLVFLVAYWCYIDGVDTIIRMAVDYGLSLGLGSKSLILALLIVQFVGFPAALAFGRLGERWGVRKSIFLGLAVYMAVTVWGAMMDTAGEFYALAVFIGLVQGGVQALSRSYYSRLIPKDKTAEFFGFYNLIGKFAAIMGPMLMGLTGLVARRVMMPVDASPEQVIEIGRLASRLGLISIMILFIIGAVLLKMVDEEKCRRAALALTGPQEAAR